MTWEGTFVAVLLPPVVVGALIGFDWQRRRRGGPAVRGVAWAPLLLALVPALLADDFLGVLLDTGEGSGAIAVVVVGMCGGVALAGRGPATARVVAGGVAAVGVVGPVLAAVVSPGPVGAAEVFTGLHLTVLMAGLSIACSLPLRRPVVDLDAPSRSESRVDGREAGRRA